LKRAERAGQTSGISGREIAGVRAAVIASEASSFLYCCSMVASRSLSSGARSRDPLVIAANDAIPRATLAYWHAAENSID
jgi:hypothetical protein